MDPTKLAMLQEQLAKQGHDHAAAPAKTGACSEPRALEDLDRSTSVLNATDASALAGVMSLPAPAVAAMVRSDADEQLLITIQRAHIGSRTLDWHCAFPLLTLLTHPAFDPLCGQCASFIS